MGNWRQLCENFNDLFKLIKYVAMGECIWYYFYQITENIQFLIVSTNFYRCTQNVLCKLGNTKYQELEYAKRHGEEFKPIAVSLC